MNESIGGACKRYGAIGDKETVAVELYSSIYFESLHVAKNTYARSYMVASYVPYAYGIQNCTIRVWYTKLYHTRMVQNIASYWKSQEIQNT